VRTRLAVDVRVRRAVHPIKILRLKRRTRLLWWLARNPIENGVRTVERLAERRAGWRADVAYPVEREWESVLHYLLGAPWPCPDRAEFSRLSEAIVEQLARRGLAVGRGAYGGWDDADPALARLAWCATRHLRARRVLETGVGRGITSRVVVQALEGSGGQIWSVDQPPPLSPRLRRQIGLAVPDELRGAWTYVRGSSRRRLPRLVRELKSIDLFIHDSMHTTRNVLFELGTALPAVRSGGLALVDDIDMNRGFELFAGAHAAGARALVGASDDGERRIGVIVKEDGLGAG
jgi:hypothetical protein